MCETQKDIKGPFGEMWTVVPSHDKKEKQEVKWKKEEELLMLVVGYVR